MCQSCADRSGDPRKAAFQPIFQVIWITQAQAEQAQQYMQTQADKTIHLETQHLFTEEDIRARIAELDDDPSVFSYTFDKTAVCLN